MDDNNTWNLLKITWQAIAAADLLITAASCCSFVATVIWKIVCEIFRIKSILLIICSSSSPVVVAEMQWDCCPQTQQATAGRLTGWPCPSCRAFRWILSERKSQIQKQMHTQTTKIMAMNHPRKPLDFAWLLGIHFQRDDIQSLTLNQRHGWFKKEEG